MLSLRVRMLCSVGVDIGCWHPLGSQYYVKSLASF